MPRYEYQCGSCSMQFEVRRGFDEESEVKCPNCGEKARQVLHPSPIFFKGGGFSKTYRG